MIDESSTANAAAIRPTIRYDREFEPGREATRRRSGGSHAALTIGSMGLLGLWIVWWVLSYRQAHLWSGEATWIPMLPWMAADFRFHIDHTARIWVSGGDPYGPGEMVTATFPYPPLVPRLFSWVSLMSAREAIGVWLTTLAVVCVLATREVWRTRRALGLTRVPPAVLLVGILYSTPVVVAMERGQCDAIILPLLMLSVGLLRTGTRAADAGAGSVLALAAWVKYYPGLLLIGLIATRRWRALLVFLVVGAAIGLADLRGVRRSIENGALLARQAGKDIETCHPLHHSIPLCWSLVWTRIGWPWVSRIPGALAAAAILGPLLAVVSLRVAKSPNASRLLYPYFLWIVSAATFALPYSNDYNLVSLPMAALAVWDRRDRIFIHSLFGFLVIWWQPFRIPIDGSVVFFVKLGGLLAVGMSIAARAREQEDACRAEARAAVPRPHFGLRAALPAGLPSVLAWSGCPSISNVFRNRADRRLNGRIPNLTRTAPGRRGSS